MSPRNTTRLLDDILAAIDRIRAYRRVAAEVPPDLLSDAVLRRLAIIGEAAARLDVGDRAHAPEVPWRDIIGLRNRVVHDYDRIDWEIIEDLVDNDLTLLARQVLALRSVLADEQDPSSEPDR